MSSCSITYKSFHPLDISICCTEKDTFSGEIKVHITDVEIKLLDLSMNGMIPGAGAYSKGDMQIATVTVESVEVNKLYEMFSRTANSFEEVAGIVRKVFKEKALLGS